jgi:8-oxo-dGTP diphosphatase
LMEKLPKLAFDHAQILEKAIARLRGKIAYEPIGFELLDEKFPFSDLHHLYETLYNRPIDRRNFKKKFLQLDILEEMAEKSNVGTKGRPGSIYKFKEEKYFKLKEKGMIFQV